MPGLIAGPLAEVFRALAVAVQEGTVTPQKPKTPNGRFKNVDAFHDLVERWRQKAAAEGWGLGHSYDECADDLEKLVGKPKVAMDDEDRGTQD